MLFRSRVRPRLAPTANDADESEAEIRFLIVGEGDGDGLRSAIWEMLRRWLVSRRVDRSPFQIGWKLGDEIMTTTHTATVVNGALQLDEPLELPEQSRVTVTVTAPTDEETRRRRRDAAEKFLASARETRFVSDGEKLTRDQLHERR